jgi:hypothetical protein
LYVVLALLDNFVPTEESLLLVLDALSGKTEEVITLTGTNPTGKLRYSEALERFVIIEPGRFNTLNDGPFDGGLEFFDPADNSLSGLFLKESSLGGDIVDAVIVSEHKGYALVGVPDNGSGRSQLVSFDPSGGEVLAELVFWDGWYATNIELHPNGNELWVTDRTLDAPGIRIFDVNSDEELTDTPIDVGLPPFMICFYPEGL